MSLLMDALRKAEADKKQAETQHKAPSGASLEAAETPVAQAQDDDDAELDLDLAATVDLKRAAARPASRAAPELSLEALTPNLLDKTHTGPLADHADRSPFATEISPPLSASAAPARSRAKLDTAELEPLLAGIQTQPPEPLIIETGNSGIKESVAGAYTVFEAGSSGPPRRVWIWGGVFTVLIAGFLIGAGYYYFQLSPRPLALPSPSVALNVEKSAPKPTALPLPVAIVNPPPGAALEPSAPPPMAVDLEPTSALPASPVAQPVDVAQLSAEPPAAPPLMSAVADSTVADSTTAPSSASTSPPQIGISRGEMRIARSTSAAAIDALMNQAYAAYAARDFSAAKTAYRAVLQRAPKKRDAQLGMAALAMHDGDVARAHQLYRAVLKADPKNPTANAALFSIEGGAGDRIGEAQLKLLLDKGVDTGYINFSLGNLYARDKRWADAQQAYFEALRHHPNNPDYNYNLAVSLDRIGQRKAALEYYTAALAFADTGAAGFDPAAALARIQTINAQRR